MPIIGSGLKKMGGLGSSVLSYSARVLSVAAPIQYCQLIESAGATITDYSGNAYNGSYVASPSLANIAGAGPTMGNAPLFNGTTQLCNLYSVGAAAAFNGLEGTISVWFKVTGAGMWTDGVAKTFLSMRVDGANILFFQKSATSNTVTLNYNAGGGGKTVTITISDTGWNNYALTWSRSTGASGEVKGYLNGTQQGATLTSIGTWVGQPASTGMCLMATTTGGANICGGYPHHYSLYATPLSAANVLKIGVAA